MRTMNLTSPGAPVRILMAIASLQSSKPVPEFCGQVGAAGGDGLAVQVGVLAVCYQDLAIDDRRAGE